MSTKNSLATRIVTMTSSCHKSVSKLVNSWQFNKQFNSFSCIQYLTTWTTKIYTRQALILLLKAEIQTLHLTLAHCTDAELCDLPLSECLGWLLAPMWRVPSVDSDAISQVQHSNVLLPYSELQSNNAHCKHMVYICTTEAATLSSYSL